MLHRFIRFKTEDMFFTSLNAVLAFAPAPQPGTVPNPTGEMLKMVGMLGFMMVIMYFAMIRGPQKKAREHAELLKTVKPGDKVVTSSGILGVVVSVKEKSMSIRSADTKLEVLKSAVSEIVEKSGSSTEA
jgi:preprotein translocase subunit YajC